MIWKTLVDWHFHFFNIFHLQLFQSGKQSQLCWNSSGDFVTWECQELQLSQLSKFCRQGWYGCCRAVWWEGSMKKKGCEIWFCVKPKLSHLQRNDVVVVEVTRNSCPIVQACFYWCQVRFFQKVCIHGSCVQVAVNPHSFLRKYIVWFSFESACLCKSMIFESFVVKRKAGQSRNYRKKKFEY